MEGKCSLWECPFVFSNFPNHLSVFGFNILEDDMNICLSPVAVICFVVVVIFIPMPSDNQQSNCWVAG